MESNSEFVYPPGHNWEGLTPSQVNEGYDKHTEISKLQETIKDEPGLDVRLEVLRSEEDSNDN